MSSAVNYDIPKDPILDVLFGTGVKVRKEELKKNFFSPPLI